MHNVIPDCTNSQFSPQMDKENVLQDIFKFVCTFRMKNEGHPPPQKKRLKRRSKVQVYMLASPVFGLDSNQSAEPLEPVVLPVLLKKQSQVNNVQLFFFFAVVLFKMAAGKVAG